MLLNLYIYMYIYLYVCVCVYVYIKSDSLGGESCQPAPVLQCEKSVTSLHLCCRVTSGRWKP